MKNIIIGTTVFILLLVGGYLVFQNNKVDQISDDAVYTTFTDEETGAEFEYKTEPDGYVLEDLTSLSREEVEGTEIVKVYRIINKREKTELETSEGGREGPPTINVLIFKNLQNQSASMWVDEFGLFSNIGLAIGQVNRDAVVAGANAVTYRTDGLYQADNFVVAHGGYIFLFTGAFHEEGSVMHKDFLNLVDSVKFTPVDSQVKIDVRVACESALAYMTFPSGEEADAFVDACIDGEHPEVIDRYIEEMGLDGAVI